MGEKRSPNIRIKVNERDVSVPFETTLLQLKEQFKPNADLIIYNGFPLHLDHPLKPGDEIVLIKKGEKPSPQEVECLMMARHTPGVHQKIRNSVIGIAGFLGREWD